MFRHIVLFKFRSDVDASIINDIFYELEKEKEIMPGIIVISWGKTINAEDSKGYTHGVIMDFTDKAAYDHHVIHSKHKELQKKLVPFLDGNLQNAVLRFDFII